MEDQRISKLIAEFLFGVCFVCGFISYTIAAVILTGTTNPFWKNYFFIGIIFLIVAIGLTVLGAGIKGAQSLSKTMNVKKNN